MRRYRVRERLEYLLVVWLRSFLCKVPEVRRDKISAAIGKMLYFWLPVRKKTILENLKIAFPHRKEYWRRKICFRCYLHFAKISFDFFPFYFADNKSFFRRVSIKNFRLVEDLIKRGSGVVLTTFHFGNWEVLGDALARSGFDVVAIVRRQKSEGFDSIVTQARTTNGIKVVSMNDNMTGITRHLQRGGILFIVPDQYAGKRGIDITFFGRKTKAFRGPATFSLRLGCPIVLACCNLVNGEYCVNLELLKTDSALESDDPIGEVTQSYFDYFEAKIRSVPEQYFWFHRRWKKRR